MQDTATIEAHVSRLENEVESRLVAAGFPPQHERAHESRTLVAQIGAKLAKYAKNLGEFSKTASDVDSHQYDLYQLLRKTAEQVEAIQPASLGAPQALREILAQVEWFGDYPTTPPKFQARRAAGGHIWNNSTFDDVPGSKILIYGLRSDVAEALVEELEKILPDGMYADGDTNKAHGDLQTIITIESDGSEEPDEGWGPDDVTWWNVEHRKLMKKLVGGLLRKVEEEAEREISAEAEKLLKKVRRLFKREGLDPDDPDDLRLRRGYSGRGMYGMTSPLAFVTGVHPNDPLGKKLVRLGFTYDTMGMSIIYYIKGDL